MNSQLASFIFGAHSLSVFFYIKEAEKLRQAMRTTVQKGGKLFEIPFGLCQLPWDLVGQIAKQEGIKEISLCHFFDGDGSRGDPLSDDPLQVLKAARTIGEIVEAAQTIREQNVVVRFIDGPSVFCLGKDYGLSWEDRRTRVIAFLGKITQMLKGANLVLAIEYLRPGEDKTIGSIDHLIEIIEVVNQACVRIHFDVFHAIEQGENPAESIIKGRKYIVYLHLHGDGRRMPGSEGDNQNWGEICEAANQIESGVQSIPVVSEPFGEDTVAECPPLGEGLPPMGPFDEYIEGARNAFEEGDLALAA